MARVLTPGWEYLQDSADGVPLIVDGIDLWKHEWLDSPDDQHVDFIRGGELYKLRVYSIVLNTKSICFAAGEFCNGGWAFCRPASTALK